jgi:hypothetical protein
MIDYDNLSKAEKSIVNGWRQACDDRNKCVSELLSLKWYQQFNYKRMNDIEESLHSAGSRWDMFWNMMIESGILKN